MTWFEVTVYREQRCRSANKHGSAKTLYVFAGDPVKVLDVLSRENGAQHYMRGYRFPDIVPVSAEKADELERLSDKRGTVSEYNIETGFTVVMK